MRRSRIQTWPEKFDNAGIEPLCKALDQVGPIARSAADLVWFFDALTSSKTAAIDLQALRIARLAGIDDVEISSDVSEAFETVMRSLDLSGIDLRTTTLEGYDPGKTRRAGLLLAEAEAAVHYRQDRERYPFAFSDGFEKLLDYGAAADSDRLAKARTVIADTCEMVDKLFETTDLLIMPTAPQTAFSFDGPVPSNQADLTALANMAGVPRSQLADRT